MLSTNPLLIQVVPQLKPSRCGVSDHAIRLAVELKAAFAVDTAFVVLNSEERSDQPFPVQYCAVHQLLETCRQLSDGRTGFLLIHLSGYGYATDGAPVLLADELDRVRADGRFRIAVYFHEMFAHAMPWKSAFWNSFKQQRIVRRIAEGCDLRVTSLEQYAAWLERKPMWESAAPVVRMPVFSSIGGTAHPAPFMEREPALAVFGLPGTRQRSYRKLVSQTAFLRALEIGRIVDIGAECGAPSQVGGIPVVRSGELDAAELVRELSRIQFGLIPNSALSLAKSSVFAGYCAQGTIPVLATPFSGEVDGLSDGVQVISRRTLEVVRRGGCQSCSTAAWNWHAKHNVHAHAALYRDWITQKMGASN